MKRFVSLLLFLSLLSAFLLISCADKKKETATEDEENQSIDNFETIQIDETDVEDEGPGEDVFYETKENESPATEEKETENGASTTTKKPSSTTKKPSSTTKKPSTTTKKPSTTTKKPTTTTKSSQANPNDILTKPGQLTGDIPETPPIPIN